MPSKYSAIVIILDGCNVESLRKAKTPIIDEIMEEGAYTLKCKSVCPSATYTGHASIIAGTHPNAHGIVGNSFYDRDGRRIVDFDVEDVNKYLTAKTLFEIVKGKSIAIGEPITRGVHLAVPKSEVQSGDPASWDSYAMKKSTELIRAHRPVLTVINLPGVDRISELHGPFSNKFLSYLEEVDTLIGDLIRVLDETYEDYLLVLLADHGMVPVHRNVNIYEILEGLDVVVCVSHRAAHIYISGEEEREETLNRLESDNRFEVVMQYSELSRYNLDNPRSGDIFVTAKEGYELGLEPLRGSHGGICSGEFIVPLIVNKREYADLLDGSSITIINRIVTRYLREKRAIDFVREMLKSTDPAHGWDHTSRVLKLATELALKHDADVEVVRLACIFHDCGRGRDPRGHEERSANSAENFLRGEGLSEEMIRRVKNVILMHHASPEELDTVEEKILWDADKLDALGLIGLARCLLEEGYRGRGIEDAIEHLLRDVCKFGNKMHFNETEKIAEERVREAMDLIKKLRGEERDKNADDI